MNIKKLNENLGKLLHESSSKPVYLVYERQYVTGESRENDDIVENIREWANIYTEKTLIEYAEDKRRDFIEMENYSETIVELDIALSFLDMAGYEVVEITLFS